MYYLLANFRKKIMLKSKQSFLRSFHCAFMGLKHAHKERNFFIMLFLGIISVIAAFIFDLPELKKMIVVILAMLVIGMELFNSAMERMLDAIIQDHHPKVGEIKDLMAGAVLVFSILSLIIGLWIFLPYIFALLE